MIFQRQDSARSSLPPSSIHGFCSNLLASRDASSYSKADIINSHTAFEKAFIESLGSGADNFCCGRRISSSPFTVSNVKLQEMANMQAAISAGLAGVLRSWGERDSWLRLAMPLSDRATKILLRCAEFRNGLPNVDLPIGCFRPDILIGEDGRLQVCEINARFTLNGFLMTLGCAEAIHSLPSSSLLGSLGIGAIPSTQSLVSAIVERFNPNETLFVVVGREKVNDLAVLEEIFDKHKKRGLTAPAVQFVQPNQLRGGNQPGTLLCISNESGNSQNVTQCILELHQDELLSLSDSVLDGLFSLSVSSRCLNPIWTILLGHDKRLLGILRSLTDQELPDKEARNFLRDHIVPSMHLESIGALERLLSTQRELLDSTLVLKPCLLGKGEGIILQKDFDTPSLFIKAASEGAEKMLEGAEQGAVFPYIVQSYVKQGRFNVICPPIEYPSLKPVARNVVATILCMDDLFLGPGVFRSSNTDIVALSNGGLMHAPALELPSFPSHVRFTSDSVQEVDACKVRSALVNDGLALVCLDQALSKPNEFESFIEDDLGAIANQHSSDVGSVWTIQPNNGGVARSHTAEPFLPHTDASYEQMPPRFMTLSTIKADSRCGGLLGIASIEKAVERLSAEDYDVLRNTMIYWRRPGEFTKDGSETEMTAAPVLFSRRRARLRTDIMETGHLSDSEKMQFWDAYNRFYAHIDDMCHKSAQLLPERTIILVDNQRLVHARTRIRGLHRHLLRIRFDFPLLPEVESVLEAANPKEGDLINQGIYLKDWPIQSKTDYMERIYSDFSEKFNARGGLYWSPSGGTTSSSKGAEMCAIPSTNEENRAMRMELVDLMCGVGAISRDGGAICAVNIFASGKLYRSMEIFGDVLGAIGATHLPLGALASDEDVMRCIARFDANTICGWGSRILQLCEAAQSSQPPITLASITTVIHGGENLSAANRSLIKKVCGRGVRIFGCYGSAEAGVFGVSMGADEDAEYEKYALLTESIYVEIVDDSGNVLRNNEWGSIIATNLKRKSIEPLVRFKMGDIGRLLHSPRFGHVLEVKGRSGEATSFRLDPRYKFFSWSDIEERVLYQLTGMAADVGATCLVQIIVSGKDIVTLAIFTSLPHNQDLLDAIKFCSNAFCDFIADLGAAHFRVKTCLLNDMSELVRSEKSQKLMLWVDQRE